MKKFCLLSALALTACGGGGGSNTSNTSNVPNPTPSSQTPAEVIYFREVKNAIPSLSLYYNKTCGTQANSFMIPTIDANNDGLKELFFVLWCPPPEHGMVYNGPVNNTFVSLIQNKDGTFRLGNQELFGRDFVQTSGALGEGANIGIGDFNGDGREDIALATSLEDGRRFIIYPDGTHSWQNQLTVIMSKPDGTYKIEFVGDVSTYVNLVVFKGKGRDTFYSGGRIWSYENEKWNSSLIRFQMDRTLTPIDDYLVMGVSPHNNKNTTFGWQVGKMDANKNFERLEYLHLSDATTVQIWNDQFNEWQPNFLTTIDNVDYVLPSYNSVCTIPGDNPNETIILAEFQAIKLLDKYTGQRLEWSVPGKKGNVDWANGLTKILAYKFTNGKLSRLNVPAFNREIKNSHYLNCVDMNNDKRKDLIVYVWGHKQEKSVIFLNGTNGWTEVPNNKIPDINPIYHGHSVLATDLNNDGKTEIVYGPGTGYKKDYAGLYDDYQVFTPVSLL